MDSNAPHIIKTHGQELSLPPRIPIKGQEQDTQLETRTGGLFFRKLFRNLFYLHLFLIVVLVIYLTIRGFLSAAHNHHFHPQKWFPPLLTATGFAAILSFLWQLLTQCNPSGAIKAAFWLSPLLTCSVAILLISDESASGMGAAAVALFYSIIQSLYSCWVSPRFNHAIRLLSVSMAFPPARTAALTALLIIVGTLYSAFVAVGIGGATAAGTSLDALFIFTILLSLTWTMHIIKYTLQVITSRVRYMNFACGADLDTSVAVQDTMKHSISSVCVGSAIVPVLSIIRGSARAISLASGDADEFMFSCTNCYSGVASRLVTYGNRWGFVHVGVYNKGFVQASMDTWEMFRRVGLEPLIDSDLTNSFCFLCGVTGGAACSLVAGTWSLAVHNGYATEESIYAFLIGYFMCRIGMAWPQACVLAYHVAYAENPESHRFDSTIPDRQQELQRDRARPSQRTAPIEF